MAWDADGTAAVYALGSNVGTGPAGGSFGSIPWSNTTSPDRIRGNNEDPTDIYFTANGGGSFASAYVLLGFIFPESRELDGAYVAKASGDDDNNWMYHSLDSTNGVDGTWASSVVTFTSSIVADDYRNSIVSLAIAGVKAVKLNVADSGTNIDANVRTVHLYGVISPAKTPDRILFLDTAASDAVFTKVLDFGDVPRGQTQTRTFKIKNNSSTKTINTIQVTAEDLYLNAGNWYTFGSDGVTYQATYAVGNLGPGATSLVYLKQIIPGAETLGAQTGRIKVSHASVT